jgi:hypothetical protein
MSKNYTYKEALDIMKKNPGKKFKADHWIPGDFIYVTKDGKIFCDGEYEFEDKLKKKDKEAQWTAVATNKVHAMNKDKVIQFLQKAGIWPKDGKIAKADLEKALATLRSNPECLKMELEPKRMELDTLKAEAAADQMDATQAKVLKQIYDLLNQLGDEAKNHLVTNLYKVAEVLIDEDKEVFDEIDAKYESLLKGATASSPQDLMAIVETKDETSAYEILSDMSIKEMNISDEHESLWWEAVSLLDMMDSKYTYVGFADGTKFVFNKGDLPKVIEAMKNAPEASSEQD